MVWRLEGLIYYNFKFCFPAHVGLMVRHIYSLDHVCQVIYHTINLYSYCKYILLIVYKNYLKCHYENETELKNLKCQTIIGSG